MRVQFLAVALALAPLAGCVARDTSDADEPTPPGPAPAPPPASDANASDDEGGSAEMSGASGPFVVVHLAHREYYPSPGHPYFEPIFGHLREAFANVTGATGDPVSMGALDDPDAGHEVVYAGLDDHHAAQLATPQVDEGAPIRRSILFLTSPDEALARKLFVCDETEMCQGYETSSNLAPLIHTARVFGGETLRYEVDGASLRDHFRAHGWVHVRLPVRGAVNVTGTENELEADSCANSPQDPNCIPPGTREYAAIDGHVTGTPPGRWNRATLYFAPGYVSASIRLGGWTYEINPVEGAPGIVLAEADPGLPAIQVQLADASNEHERISVLLGGEARLNATVPDDRPFVRTPWFTWNDTRPWNETSVVVTVERDGEPIGEPAEVPLWYATRIMVQVEGNDVHVTWTPEVPW